MALLTAAEAKTYVPQLDDVDSVQLGLLLEVASLQLESICNRKFAASDYHEKQTGDGGCETFVSNPPILRLDSVEYLGTSGTKYINSGIEFCTVTDIGQLRFKQSQSSEAEFYSFTKDDLSNVTINYRGGYETLPYDLKLLISWWAYGLYQESASTTDLKSESLQEYSYTKGTGSVETGLPQRIQDILNAYRLISPM